MTVMEIADTLGIPAVEDDLQPYDLYTSYEAFFCSAPYSILPVGRIDRREVGECAPGPITNHCGFGDCRVPFTWRQRECRP